jgi:hypothetical protein
LTRPLTARRPLTEIIVVIRGPMGRVRVAVVPCFGDRSWVS